MKSARPSFPAAPPAPIPYGPSGPVFLSLPIWDAKPASLSPYGERPTNYAFCPIGAVGAEGKATPTFPLWGHRWAKGGWLFRQSRPGPALLARSVAASPPDGLLARSVRVPAGLGPILSPEGRYPDRSRGQVHVLRDGHQRRACHLRLSVPDAPTYLASEADLAAMSTPASLLLHRVAMQDGPHRGTRILRDEGASRREQFLHVIAR